MQSNTTVPVWDIAVRLFHWSLVAAFIVAYLSGDELEFIHVNAGYIVLGLITFRVIWGFIGSRHARFSDFVKGPASTIQHLKSMVSRTPKHYLGHNPAGGAMVIALLVCLLLTGYTGLKLYAAEGHGPLAGAEISLISSALADDDHDREHEDAEEFWEEIHEFASNLTLLLVFLHILGVVVSSRLEGENLARAMVTGRKQARDPNAPGA